MGKINIDNLVPISLETIMCFNPRTGVHRFTLDELQNAKIANTEDKLKIAGKGGRTINSLKRNKAVVVTAANGLLSTGMLEVQSGSEWKSGVTPVRVPDYLTINGDEAETNWKAVGTIGNEIGYVDIKDSYGVFVERLTQSDNVGTGKFKYTPATKKLTFNSGDYTDGTQIVAHYDRAVQADVLSNISDKYSEKVTAYIDAFAEEKCTNKIYRVQYYIPLLDTNGNYDIDFGDNQTVHNFEGESLASACGAASKFWDMIVFGEDAADVI